jgi:hypothetical protein
MTKETTVGEMFSSFDEALKSDLFREQAENKKLFDIICPEDDWKMPFTCVVPTSMYAFYNRACIWFTGAELVVQKESDGMTYCDCVGYYNAMG